MFTLCKVIKYRPGKDLQKSPGLSKAGSHAIHRITKLKNVLQNRKLYNI